MQVGAVTLGGVLAGDVGRSRPARCWQEAACSRAEPSPGLTAKMVEPQLTSSRSGPGIAVASGAAYLCQRPASPLRGMPACGGFLRPARPWRGPTYCGILAGEGELRQPQRVGAVGGGLAGGDQLVRGGDRVGDVARPPSAADAPPGRASAGQSLMLGPKLELCARIGLAEAVDRRGSRRCCRRSDRLRVAGVLRPARSPGSGMPPLAAVAAMERASISATPASWPLAGLGALAVGEVAGGVADGRSRRWRAYRPRRSRGRRRQSRTVAPGGHQIGEHAVAHQLHDRRAGCRGRR